jgi:heat shock protein HslJ
MDRRIVAGLFVIALLLAACGPAPAPDMSPLPEATKETPGTPLAAAALTGTEWILSGLQGDTPLEDAAPTVVFYPDSYMEGSAGCNSFGSDYTISGQTFQAAEIHQTRFECEAPPGIMDQDRAFLEALAQIATYQATEEQLTFQDAAGEMILTFARKRAAAVDAALVDTTWVLISLEGEDLLEGSHIELSLDKAGFGGFAGCNRYGGEYEAADEGQLILAEIAVTAMDCPTPEGIVAQETRYLQALHRATTYRLDGDQLALLDDEGERLLRYQEQEAYGGAPSVLMGPTWRLVSMNGQVPTGDQPITLTFHDDEWGSGRAACRDYAFTYQAEDGNLDFGLMAMLGEVCGDEALLAQESEYTTILGWTARYQLEGERLALYTTRGETLIYEPLPVEAQPALEGTTWRLLAFLQPNPLTDDPVPNLLPAGPLPGTEITAIFQEGSVQGSAGCNSYQAGYTRDGGNLTVERPAPTKKLCQMPEGVMAQEQHYLERLEAVTEIDLYGYQLWLALEDGQALIYRRDG